MLEVGILEREEQLFEGVHLVTRRRLRTMSVGASVAASRLRRGPPTARSRSSLSGSLPMRAAARSNASGARTTPEAPAPTPSRITAGATLANRAFLGGGAGIGCPRWLTVTEVASPSGAGAGVSATRVLSAASSRGGGCACGTRAPLGRQPEAARSRASVWPRGHRAGRRAGERIAQRGLVREHVRHGLVDRHGRRDPALCTRPAAARANRLGEAARPRTASTARVRRRHEGGPSTQWLARRAARVDPLEQHDRQPQLERAREMPTAGGF